MDEDSYNLAIRLIERDEVKGIGGRVAGTEIGIGNSDNVGDQSDDENTPGSFHPTERGTTGDVPATFSVEEIADRQDPIHEGQSEWNQMSSMVKIEEDNSTFIIASSGVGDLLAFVKTEEEVACSPLECNNDAGVSVEEIKETSSQETITSESSAEHLLCTNGKTLCTQPIHPETDEKPLRCPTCDKEFSEKYKLTDHMRCHKKPFQCEYCNKEFSRKYGLELHIRTHTKEKPFKCKICGRGFSHTSHLGKHERLHKNKPFFCETCGKAYVEKSELDIHIVSHTGPRPYKCDHCDKDFVCNSALFHHQRYHLKPFRCETCGKAFGKPSDLRNHERTHTREKPFTCIQCGRAFADNSNLNRHISTHAIEKPFKCRVCEKSFAQNSSLQRHIAVHTEEGRVSSGST